MKAEDLKTKTQDELKKLLLDTRKEQMNLRFQNAGSTLGNTSEIRKTRRTIARIKTFLNQQVSGTPSPSAKKEAPKKATKTKKTTAAKKKTAA